MSENKMKPQMNADKRRCARFDPAYLARPIKLQQFSISAFICVHLRFQNLIRAGGVPPH
jgi:hypothetical protein